MARPSSDESRVARRVKTTLLPSLNSGPPRTALIFSEGRTTNKPGGRPDETTVDIRDMKGAVDKDNADYIRSSSALTESVASRLSDGSNGKASARGHGIESVLGPTQLNPSEQQRPVVAHAQGRSLFIAQVVCRPESGQAPRGAYDGSPVVGLASSEDTSTSHVEESTLRPSVPSQEIQFVVHGQTQTHIANTPGTQHFDDATPHGPEKDHLQAPTPPPEDVFMSAPQAGVDDSHEELSSAPTVNVGNFNPRLGEQETVAGLRSHGDQHMQQSHQDEDQWRSNPFEPDVDMHAHHDVSPPLPPSHHTSTRTGSLGNTSLTHVSMHDLENDLAGLVEGPQAEIAALKRDIGRLHQLVRRVIPFLSLLDPVESPAPSVSAPAGPGRTPRPPRRVAIRSSVSRMEPPNVPLSDSSVAAVQVPRRVQLPKNCQPKYRLSEREYRDPNTVDLQAHVRSAARDFLHRESRKADFPAGPSRSEKAAAKRGVVGPDPDNPRLDVSGKEMRSPWNKAIAVMFSQYYVSLSDALTQDRHAVEEAFLSHIPAMCKQAQKVNSDGALTNNVNSGPGVVANRRRGRRREIGNQRWQTCLSEPSLKPISGWVNRIGTDGNSGDESGGEGEPDFWIDELDWRADDLKTILRALDIVRLSHRFIWDGTKWKTTPGKWPRYRTERLNHKKDFNVRGVPGLPRNFYDRQWLDMRSEWELARLEVLDFDVDLSVPPDVQSIVDRFSHIKSRQDKPLGIAAPANQRPRGI